MEWFYFLFTTALFFISLYWVREKYTIFRLVLFSVVTLLFGLLLTSGINFPSGISSTVNGLTTVQTITYTTYTASLSGANSFPLLFGLYWSLIAGGIFGLLFSLVEIFRVVFDPTNRSLRMM